MIREKGVSYYCNLASPYVLDDEALKYIDYDLDVKVFPDGEKRLLTWMNMKPIVSKCITLKKLIIFSKKMSRS